MARQDSRPTGEWIGAWTLWVFSPLWPFSIDFVEEPLKQDNGLFQMPKAACVIIRETQHSGG